MGRKILFSFSLIFVCVGFSLTLEQIFARKNVSSRTSSSKEVVIKSGKLALLLPVKFLFVLTLEELVWSSYLDKWIFFQIYPCLCDLQSQALNYNLSRQGHLVKEPWNAFSHDSPVNVSMDGIPCILFWAKRITIKFKNQIWLDLTEETFGQKATVDATNSNCSEESAKLSLKFDDAENPKGLEIRFTLTNYNKFSLQSWFSLHRVEIIFNNSIQATFNATGIYAPSSYSYHCQHVSSQQQYGALLLPSDMDDMSSLWEVTFIDFQIQGFTMNGAQFAKARDCASPFSPAILIGLAMSLILLLVLAYALHMLIYLRHLDRHYDFITSPAHFPQLKAPDAAEEKELLRSQGVESYELRTQQICKMYV